MVHTICIFFIFEKNIAEIKVSTVPFRYGNSFWTIYKHAAVTGPTTLVNDGLSSGLNRKKKVNLPR